MAPAEGSARAPAKYLQVALVCEELKVPAATCQLMYPVTPTKAPFKLSVA